MPWFSSSLISIISLSHLFLPKWEKTNTDILEWQATYARWNKAEQAVNFYHRPSLPAVLYSNFSTEREICSESKLRVSLRMKTGVDDIGGIT
jgi:hypothetical protein